MRRAALLGSFALALLGPAVAGAQKPQLVAQGKIDVDGDGDLDDIELANPTQIVVRIDGKPGDVFDRFEVDGTPVNATFEKVGKVILVVVQLTRDGGDRFQHAVILRWEKGNLFGDWQGGVGPVGRDAEYSVSVAVEGGQLLRYETRPDVKRCDGKASRLFAQTFAGKAFGPAKLEPDVDPSATTLAVSMTAPEIAPVTSAVYRATASSTHADADNASELTRPRELDDGDATTVWKEARLGDGRGEFITYRSNKAGAKLAGFRLIAGDARSQKQFLERMVPKRLAVVTPTHAWWITVKVQKAFDQPVWIMLPEPIAADCVTIVLDGGVKAGAKAKEVVAISELVALADKDISAGGIDTDLVNDVIAGGIAGDSATKQLARRGAKGARAVEAALADPDKKLDAAARERLFATLGVIADPASAPVLAAALRDERLADETVAGIADGLVKAGAPGLDALAEVAAAAKAPDGARIAAIERLPTDRGEALAAALGGTRAVRRAATLKLGAQPVDWLTEKLDGAIGASEVDREADLTRALGLAAARADDATRGAVIDELAARLAAVTDYERRYRGIEALAAIDDARAVAALAKAVAALPGDGAEPAALRQVAAAGLARMRADGSAELLGTLAEDADPGVRLAALGAIAGRADLGGEGAWEASASPDAVDRVLQNALSKDAWPEVRRAAAVALGGACTRAGPRTSLEDAADRDKDLGVRMDSLTSLVTCKATAIAERLFTVARAKDAPPTLRTHAISLLAALGDPKMIDGLITAFDRWRNEAFSDEASLEVARQAANTLGILGGIADAKTAGRAADALIAAARDGAFPELQAAALGGLGELKQHCPASAKKLIGQLVLSDQVNVKLAAERARAMCGK